MHLAPSTNPRAGRSCISRMTTLLALTTFLSKTNGFVPMMLRHQYRAVRSTFGLTQVQQSAQRTPRTQQLLQRQQGQRFSTFRSTARDNNDNRLATDFPRANGSHERAAAASGGTADAGHASAAAHASNSHSFMADSSAKGGILTNVTEEMMQPVAPISPTQLATDLPANSGALGDNQEAAYLSIDPNDVEIVALPPEPKSDEPEVSPEITHRIPFVSMFRGSAKYIANHRNTLVVFHIPGELIADVPSDCDIFRDLMNDIALTWLLGMKICIVVGCRHQIESRLKDADTRPCHHGIKVTDARALRIVKEEAGYVKFEVERQLARSLRNHGADIANGSDGNQRSASQDGSASAGQNGGATQAYFGGNVISGNFYSAQPIGILDGIDFEYSGFVRRVETERIRQVLQNRDIVLLSTLGVSPSGEVFNVNSENLAATVAGTMGASKIVFIAEDDVVLRHKEHGNQIQNLRVAEGRKLLQLNDVRTQKRGFDYLGPNAPADPSIRSMLIKIGWSINALDQGVKRAHIISPTDGALLQELYTRDGAGTMISRDVYDGIRPAKAEDIPAIYDLIQPLVATGTLVDRSKSLLERTIDNYHLYLRDGLVIACGQLKMYEDGFAEIACLVVNPAYRSQGRGDAMLGYLERICLRRGASVVFVLSTQTMEWFMERGFAPVTVDKLPPSRQAQYNYSRNSKIYMKRIDNERDLDAAELWWNR